MPEIHVKKLAVGYTTVIEDPTPANNRLYLSTVGHDTTTLAPLFQRNFHYNRNDIFDASDTTHTDNAGHMILEKGTITCWSQSEVSDSYFDNFYYSTFHQSLDPAFFPTKKAWKTINNRVLMINSQSGSSAGVSVAGGATGNPRYLYPSTDITGGAGSSGYFASSQMTQFCYEDITNNRMWGLSSGGGQGCLWIYNNTYETTVADSGTVTPPNNGFSVHFFLGVDDQGFINGVGVQDNNSTHSVYTFYRINPTTFAVTTTLNLSTRTSSTQPGARQWPSNIRRASSTRRVIYSCHYDATNNLSPIRYVFNPTDGTVTSTVCTVTYPGANTHSTYATRMSTTGVNTTNGFSWHMKGQQFTVGGTNYITYWITDKRASIDSQGLTRWATAAQRTMLTFSIGSGTGDDVLTFHSAYTFPTANDLPRDFLPINAAGTQVIVPVTGQARFFGFNAVTGWAPTGTYPFEFRGLGLDQTNRILGITREKGFSVVHMITPTIPVTINVIMASQNFTFTGSNISTSCTVDAFGSDGSRIAVPVNLAIDGNTMIFTTNGTKNLTVTTSASASTTVNLTITGGGVNNIIASIDI
jgi:hypothetical protein